MTKFLFTLTLFFCTQISSSQTNDYYITGTVISKTSNQPIPYVTVYVKNGKEIKTDLTDELGTFKIENLSPKKYNLTIESIGFKTINQTISFDNSRFIDLKKIYLEENIEALSAVILRAETSSVTQKIDRVVINVGKDLTSVGTDASDVLNNVQSVSVDQQSGELSLRGNTNVRVLVDGKPTNIPTEQLLQQIPSNAIKNIELITNPSAKYNPEGNSGIINIELIKNSQLGVHGSLNLSSGYGKNFRNSAGGNINYKTKKVNFYGNYNFNDGKKNTLGKIERIEPEKSYQAIDGNDDFTNHFLKFGADISITKKTNLDIAFSQSTEDYDYFNITDISETRDADLLSENVFSFERESTNQTYNAGIYQQIGDNEDHLVSFESMYSIRTKPQDNTWTNNTDLLDKTSNYFEETTNNNYLILNNLDYKLPFAEDSYIEAGLEYREENTVNSNISDQETINSNSDIVSTGKSEFDYNRKLYSAYLNYKQQFDGLGIQAGLRAESFNVDAVFSTEVDNQQTFVKQSKFSLYPSFFATYNLNNENQLQFSYSRRVDRPSIKKITPIRTWGTPLTTSIGNPDLKQEFTNSVEFKYNRELKMGNVSSTVFFRNTKDNISRTITQDESSPEIAILSYGNFDDINSYGIELSAYLRILKWWRINTSTDFYSRKITGEVANISRTVNNNRFNFKLSNTLNATDKLNFQLSGLYRGPSKSIQQTRDAMHKIDLSSSYRILNDKGTITLGVSDLFNTFRYSFGTDIPFNQSGEFRWESRRVTLGFVYNFGIKPKESKKRRRQVEQESSDSGGGF